jgi:hypothetical protein
MDDHGRELLLRDADQTRFHAGWSKSKKSLIVTVGPPDPSGRRWRQILLSPEQAAQLRDFLTETLPD